jgi:hypothetical protein
VQPARRNHNPRIAVFLPEMERPFIRGACVEGNAIARLGLVDGGLQGLACRNVNRAAVGLWLSRINNRLRQLGSRFLDLRGPCTTIDRPWPIEN